MVDYDKAVVDVLATTRVSLDANGNPVIDSCGEVVHEPIPNDDMYSKLILLNNSVKIVFNKDLEKEG